MKTIWDDHKHGLNIPAIDNQHKELFSIAEGINELDRDCTARDILVLIKRLYSYTNYHFCTEEDLFMQFNYPEAESHIRLHRAFTRTVKSKFDDIQAGKEVESLSLLTFLTEWIENHIAGEDRSYADFFADSGLEINKTYAVPESPGKPGGLNDEVEKLWSGRKLALNISEIDNQHRELVLVLQQVSDLNKTGVSDARVRLQLPILIRKLFYYSQIHFSEEEDLMVKIGYAGIEEHKRLHRTFIQEVRNFAEHFGSGKKLQTDEIIKFLKEWTISHILDEDIKIKKFINGERI